MKKKEERKFIYDKYNGHCAYCGEEIKLNAFEIDHFEALKRWDNNIGGSDTLENKMPACRKCNRAKKTYDIETWRGVISAKINELNRDSGVYRMAKRFGLIKETGASVKFYFERTCL